MIWLFEKQERILRGYFESKGEFNVIEWRPEGWRITRVPTRETPGIWYEEIDKDTLIKKNVFRNTMHVILENPEDIKREWK